MELIFYFFWKMKRLRRPFKATRAHKSSLRIASIYFVEVSLCLFSLSPSLAGGTLCVLKDNVKLF